MADGEQQSSGKQVDFKFLHPAPRPKELTGASDLLGHHGLRQRYESLCRHPPPGSLVGSGYLSGVLGSTEVRKGEGMALGPLLQPPSAAALAACQVAELDPESLRAAFTFRESTSARIPEGERGTLVEQEGVQAAGAQAAVANGGGDRKRKHKDKERERGKDGEKDAGREGERHRHKARRKENGELANGDDERHKKSKRKRDDAGKDSGEPQDKKATIG